MREAHPSRRALLATGGALALSACLPTADTAPPRPDLRLRRRVAAEVAELAAAYATAVAAHPDLGSVLAPLMTEHRAHIAALAGPPASTSPTPSGSAGGPTTKAPAAVPATSSSTLAWLTDLERGASRRRRGQALRASDSGLVRLLASVGGCEAAHAALLERAVR